MSKSVSPAAIGGFTLGALILLIVGIFAFGGGNWFSSDKVRYVIFFESSLNGLEKGAPVKMQGVKVGEVIEISLLIDRETTKLYKPVVVEIDRHSLLATTGSDLPVMLTAKERLQERDRIVNAGFRARLEIQSLLTGLLYVDLDIHKEKPPLYTNLEYKDLLELPGIPATADEIRNTAEKLAQKIQDLPLERIVTDLAATLQEVRALLSSEDVRQSRVVLASSLQQLQSLLASANANMGPLLNNANETMLIAQALLSDIRQDIKPVLKSADKTIRQTEQAMTAVNDVLVDESGLHETLSALKQAARSVKSLADFLERHPESIISGKNK